MFWVDTTILISSVLLLLGVLSSKFSARLGMPALVMFLGLGMLAGSEGIGGIEFEDYSLAYAIGTLVLAIILFSGGLATPMSAIRDSWRPAGLLATVGVLLTALITGAAASWILGIPLAQGLLLGSIVGSTDASAVFSILRAGGIHIRRSLSDTLEVESASNDPMAIFLTLGMVQYLTGELQGGLGLVQLLLQQVLIGLGLGVTVGWVAIWGLRKIRLGVAGLYPVLAMAFGLMSYGLAADLGGSGFLATFLTGLVIGNQRTPFLRGIQSFHDATAGLCQIVMFILLGLLSFPLRLPPLVVPGLLIAVGLMVVARPLAVYLCLLGKRFNVREKLFLSWVGLKGAVPITLAIFPLMAQIDGATMIFDVVFFVVLVSAVVQGSSMNWMAQRLNLSVPPRRESPVTLEISSLHEIDADIVDYYIDANTRVAGKSIRELALPEEVVVALVVRRNQSRLPKGSFRIEAGDHVLLVVHRDVRKVVDRIFARTRADKTTGMPAHLLEFPLRGSVQVREFEETYGIPLGLHPEWTLGQWLRSRLSDEECVVGAVVEAFPMRFRIRELGPRGRIEGIGLTFMAAPFGSTSRPHRGRVTCLFRWCRTRPRTRG